MSIIQLLIILKGLKLELQGNAGYWYRVNSLL